MGSKHISLQQYGFIRIFHLIQYLARNGILSGHFILQMEIFCDTYNIQIFFSENAIPRAS